MRGATIGGNQPLQRWEGCIHCCAGPSAASLSLLHAACRWGKARRRATATHPPRRRHAPLGDPTAKSCCELTPEALACVHAISACLPRACCPPAACCLLPVAARRWAHTCCTLTCTVPSNHHPARPCTHAPPGTCTKWRARSRTLPTPPSPSWAPAAATTSSLARSRCVRAARRLRGTAGCGAGGPADAGGVPIFMAYACTPQPWFLFDCFLKGHMPLPRSCLPCPRRVPASGAAW